MVEREKSLEMVNRQYLQTPRSKMNETAGNLDYLCSKYLTEMSVVATIADLAVKEAEKPPPSRATPPTPREDSPPPRMGVIPRLWTRRSRPTGWREALPFDWSIESRWNIAYFTSTRRGVSIS